MKKTTKVSNGQNILDQSIQLTGSIEGVFDVIRDSDTLSSVNDILSPGQEVGIAEDAVIKPEITSYLEGLGIQVNTGEYTGSLQFDTTYTGTFSITITGQGSVYISWGDDSREELALSSSPHTHTYTSSGTKTVQMEFSSPGSVTSIIMDNQSLTGDLYVRGFMNLEVLDVNNDQNQINNNQLQQVFLEDMDRYSGVPVSIDLTGNNMGESGMNAFLLQAQQAVADGSVLDLKGNTYNLSSLTDLVAPLHDRGVTFIVLGAPSSLTETSFSYQHVDLNWTDGSSGGVGFEIWRSEEGGSFILIGTTNANVVQWSDTTVSESTTYTYKVRAVIDKLPISAFSNDIQVNTPSSV